MTLARVSPAFDLIGDAAVTHREDLKATRVGHDRTLPSHKAVQAAKLAHELGPRREEQVKRVREDQFVAERFDVPRLERLDGALCRERDECRRAHIAVGEVERASARQRAAWRGSGP